jgi:very-short-patch-repair endonuclease
MAYPGEWLEGYGLASDPATAEPSNGELLPIGCGESLISLELAECLTSASRNLPYHTDAPLEIPRSRSVVWLRKALLRSACMQEYRAWMKAAEACESPIETVGFLCLCASLAIGGFPMTVTAPGESPQLPELADRMTLAQIVLQEPADDYRIDLALHFNCRLGKHIFCRDLAIECDGIEFHSTPMQRAHDDAKSKFLVDVGFSVLRFSGAETWNEAPELNQKIIRGLRRFCGQLIHGNLPDPAAPRTEVKHQQRPGSNDTVYRT